MGLFSRIRIMFESEASGALDSLEDPGRSLDYSLLRLEDNLRQARRSLLEIVTSQRALQSRSEEAAQAAARYAEQARAAVESGREDLARLALERRQNVLARRRDLQNTAAGLETQAESLRATLLGLHTRIEIFRGKKEELKAIYESSRAQLRVREALTGLSGDLDDVGRTIQRTEARIRRMQARAEAINDLAAAGAIEDVLLPPGDDIDRELGLGDRAAAIKTELAQLKQEVAGLLIENGDKPG